MEIGLISDIHGNLPGLEAVLSDMGTTDRLVCLGDIIGYNPFPAECLEVVRSECDLVIQGNHDRMLETYEAHEGYVNNLAYEGLKFAHEELDEEQKLYLRGLPKRTTVEGTAFLAVHSHPENTDEYVQPEQFPTMIEYLDNHDGLVLGHTHIQHVLEIEDKLILNPGSAGQPRDGDRRVAYAVVDTASDGYELGRVEYDVERVIQAIQEADLPEETGERLLEW